MTKSIELILKCLLIIIPACLLSSENTALKEMRQDYRYPDPEICEIELESSFPSDNESHGEAYLKEIYKIEIDPVANVYVLDSKTSRIVKFDSRGNYIGIVGRAGQGPGEYLSPRRLCFTGSGDLIVYDYGNGRIQTINQRGEYISSFKTFKYVQDIGSFEDDIFLTSIEIDPNNDLIEKYSHFGKRIGSFGRDKRIDIKDFRSVDTRKIAIGQQGEIIIAWQFFNWMQIYSNAGKLLNSFVLEDTSLEETSRANLLQATSQTQRPSFRVAVASLRSFGNDLFILAPQKNHIEIKRFSKDGILRSVYRANVSLEKFYYQDFVINNTNNEIGFYLARTYPDTKVERYVQKRRINQNGHS